MLNYKHKYLLLHLEINCTQYLLKSKVSIEDHTLNRSKGFFFKRSDFYVNFCTLKYIHEIISI